MFIRCVVQSLKYMLDGERVKLCKYLCDVVLVFVPFLFVKTISRPAVFLAYCCIAHC